jgi:hypothetical protein
MDWCQGKLIKKSIGNLDISIDINVFHGKTMEHPCFMRKNMENPWKKNMFHEQKHENLWKSHGFNLKKTWFQPIHASHHPVTPRKVDPSVASLVSTLRACFGRGVLSRWVRSYHLAIW